MRWIQTVTRTIKHPRHKNYPTLGPKSNVFANPISLSKERGRSLSVINYSDLAKIIGKENKKKLLLFSTLRVVANGLDIIGIAGVALLATAFSSFARSGGRETRIDFPVVGGLEIGELEAVAIAFGVAMVFVLKSVFSALLNLKTSLFIADLESGLSSVLARDFFQLSPSSPTEGNSVSDIQNSSMTSTSGLKTYLNSRVLLIAEGSLLIGLSIVLLIINPIAAVALTAFMAIVLGLFNWVTSRGLKRNGDRQLTGSHQALQSLSDLAGVKREAQAAGTVDSLLNRFSIARKMTTRAEAMSYTLNGLPRFVVETTLIMSLFMFIGGVVIFSDITSQAVTIGVFLAGGLRMMASVIPFQGAITSMRNSAAKGRIAIDLLKNINEVPSENPPQDDDLFPRDESLKFQNVSFSYRKGGERVISDVSFEVKPFTKVAIVGPSGAGKSTIFDLAMGFLMPDRGEVTLGKKAVRQILMNKPGAFAVVPQRSHAVNGTLLENVSLISHDETDATKVKKVLLRAGLEKLVLDHDWQKRLLGTGRNQLSGGELQRLSLARALYRDPEILFLDEATSALDAQTEFEISQVLDELQANMTVVLITHRLSTIKSADRIVYLDKGQIVAEGTFSEMRGIVPDFARAIEIMRIDK